MSSAHDIADRLHSAAIHLLRRVRAEDAAAGLTGPQLSALSVIVFRGPIGVSALADAEQVRPPTISRLVSELERRGLVEQVSHRSDARRRDLVATGAGRRLLAEGRARRIQRITRDIEDFSAAERSTLLAAATLLEQLGQQGQRKPK